MCVQNEVVIIINKTFMDLGTDRSKLKQDAAAAMGSLGARS